MTSASSPVPLDALLEHREWVRALARSLVRDDASADDVAQEAWLAALRHPPHDAATARGWFAVVARNAARASGRSASRRQAREAAAARDEAVPASDEVVAAAEVHRRVVEAVMQLAEPYRTTVLLRFFEGLGLAETAARTGVPPETARTRLRRALALLRERLAPAGDEDARGALLVLAGEGAAEAASGPSPRRGRRVLGATVAAFVVAAAAIVAAVLVPRGDDGGRDAAGAAPPSARGAALAPPPAPIVAGADDAKRGPAAPSPADEGEEPAPAAPSPGGTAPAASAATATLRLHAATDPVVPCSGDPFELVVTFENAGGSALKFFVPDRADPFPAWRLSAEDGGEFAPSSWIGQSMWHGGLQGALVELAPGATWVRRSRVAEFTPRGEGGADDWQVRAPLRPGRYLVQCSYAQATDELPFSDKAFAVVRRPVEGVWTGAVKSDEIAVQVAPCPRPTLTIESPRQIVRGRENRVEAVAANPGETDVVLKGALVIRAYTKGEGAVAELRVRPADRLEGPAENEDAGTVLVPARSSVRWSFDFRLDEAAKKRSLGYVVVVASVEDDPKAPSIRSNALWRRIVLPAPEGEAR